MKNMFMQNDISSYWKYGVTVIIQQHKRYLFKWYGRKINLNIVNVTYVLGKKANNFNLIPIIINNVI